MLKKLIILSVSALMFSSPAFAQEPIRIQIDGKPLVTEVAPQMENNRTMVPFRVIFEKLGLKVDWNSQLKIATAYNEQMNVSIKVGAAYGNINGELKALEAPGKIVDGRTLVPLRFISEAFGNDVTWNATQRLVSIKSGFKPYVYSQALPTVGSLEKLKLIMDYAGKYQPIYYTTMESANDAILAPAPATTDKSGAAPSVSADALPSAGSVQHSTTNVQVAGVDESDIVKTDGKYIYQIRQNDLKITEVSAGIMKPAAVIKFENLSTATEMYLYNKKLIVIGTKQNFMPYPILNEKMANSLIMPMPIPKTTILFYDVADPTKPILLRKFECDGAYMTSRVTGGSLYLIANKWLNAYSLTAETVRPEFSDTLLLRDSQAVKTTSLGFDKIRYFPDTVESNLMVTLGFNLDQMGQEPDKAAYLGSGGNVYADTGSLVVAMNRYHYDFTPQNSMIRAEFYNTTELFKFTLGNSQVRFTAKGTVPGTVLNQFSMDAYNGNYRIATTSGETWSQTSKNNIYVLDATLQLKGKLEGLAPTERIYAARFIGDRAYLVTFRQVDPFYVIDLKDPSSPKVLGYLKIPGFSDYLHPYDSNTIIGFGKDIIETANGPIQGGIKIAMFDVTDVANPTEKSKVILGSSGSWSEVLNNHKALLFAKEKNLFAIPVTLYSGFGNEYRLSFQGGYVYQVDPLNGFVLKGTSSHLTQAEVDDNVLKGYDSSKNVNRILWIGNEIYSLSEYGIKSHELGNMQQKAFIIH